MTMQRNYFSILFFIRRTRLLKNGEAPIGLRITVNGQRVELQIKRSVPDNKWNAAKGCAVGKDRKTQLLAFQKVPCPSRNVHLPKLACSFPPRIPYFP
jgi:hypothetical protein